VNNAEIDQLRILASAAEDSVSSEIHGLCFYNDWLNMESGVCQYTRILVVGCVIDHKKN
jgi:hypothetical protein